MNHLANLNFYQLFTVTSYTNSLANFAQANLEVGYCFDFLGFFVLFCFVLFCFVFHNFKAFFCFSKEIDTFFLFPYRAKGISKLKEHSKVSQKYSVITSFFTSFYNVNSTYALERCT